MGDDIEIGYELNGKRHVWWLRGPKGGVHVWAGENPAEFQARWGERYYGGIECHSPKPLYSHSGDTPDHDHCWVLKGPCWHDGSSLQFSEEIEPFMRHAANLRDMDDFMFATCLDRYRSWFDQDAALPVATHR